MAVAYGRDLKCRGENAANIGGMMLYLSTFVVGLSAGILIYSGYLLVAPGQLHWAGVVDEATEDEYGSAIGELDPRFPVEEIQSAVERALDSKMGLLLLVLGTLGTAFATLITSAAPQTLAAPWWLNLVTAAVGCVLGWAIAPPLVHSIWRKWQAPRAVTNSFFIWLERELGAWRTKGWTLTLAIGNTARHSGYWLLAPMIRQCGSDDEALCRQECSAWKHNFRWRDPDFQELAETVASKPRGFRGRLLRFLRH